MRYYTVNRPLDSGGTVPLTLSGDGVGYSTRGLRAAVKFADAASARMFADWVNNASGIRIYQGQKDSLEIKEVDNGCD